MSRLAAAVGFLALVAPSAALALEPLGVEEVAPGVYVHAPEPALILPQNQGDIANLGFIIGEEAIAVIDTGGSVAVGEALLAAVRQASDLPVSHVFNTHMHPDHTFGNAAFRGSGPDGGDPTFVGHRKLADALAARATHYLESNAPLLGAVAIARVEIVLPDEAIAAEASFDLGNRELIARAWPTAHTDNDLTVLDVATGTLFAGDLLFLKHLPVVDGSLTGWLDVIDELASLPVQRIVPGHGPASAELPAAFAPERRYLEDLAAGLRAAIADGEPLAEAVEGLEAPDEDWMLVEEFHKRNATAGYAELEWE